MVSQDSPPNHQFIFPDSIADQSQFQTQNFNSYGVLPTIQTLEQRICGSMEESPLAAQDSDSGTHLMDLLGANGGLSLSLGSQMLVDYSFSGNEFPSPANPLIRESSSNCYGAQSFGVPLKDSRYLKPTQILLDEFVRVSDEAVETSNEKYLEKLLSGDRRGVLGLYSELKSELFSNGGFFSADSHDLQAKLAKLIQLLDQVEGRYEKYYHQMEQVALAFEEIVGSGAAKSYTGLALQAMSRHFCSLRDAIVAQINAARRKFSPQIGSGMARLSLLDKEGKNSRVPLHQLGLIGSHRQAWRPIRGLPETSVMILRTWLFEHFLHPYPNDSEKLMLASQTGLTKNQISNWFINARVRLWKPMIEEIYKEEFAESSEDSNPALSCSSMTREGAAVDCSDD